MWRIARLGRANRRSSLPLSPSHYHENRFPFSFSFPRFFPRPSSVGSGPYPVTFCSCELDGIFRCAPIAVINIRRCPLPRNFPLFLFLFSSYSRFFLFFFLFFPRHLNILRCYLDGFTAIFISSNRFWNSWKTSNRYLSSLINRLRCTVSPESNPFG